MASVSENIISTFLEAAARHPETTALLQDGDAYTYKELLRQVEQTASSYRLKGLAKGSKVLVFVSMSADLYRIVLSLLYIGACPVFIDEWVSVGRLKTCLDTVPCEGLVAGRKHLLLSWFVPALRRIPIRIAAGSSGKQKEPQPPVSVNAGDTALVTFTTGSTGIPKAADRTHAFLYAQLHALEPLLHGIESPCLTTLPIVVLLHLAKGRTALLPPRAFKPAKEESTGSLGESVLENAPGSIIASPAIADRLISWLRDQHRKSPASVTTVLTGGGPVYPDLAQRLLDAFPQARVTAVYGSTEAEPISHIDGRALAATPADVIAQRGMPLGLPDASASVRILQHEVPTTEITNAVRFEASLASEGDAGEIIVSGEHVLRHYINNPAAEAATKIRFGAALWHRTGDCGRIDGNGMLYLLGRVSEVVEWQGRQLFPAVLDYQLRVACGVGICALLLKQETLLLVLEEGDRAKAPACKLHLQTLGVRDLQVVIVMTIPRDPRHRTKVDYATLRTMI